jgi:hypothetical protein
VAKANVAQDVIIHARDNAPVPGALAAGAEMSNDFCPDLVNRRVLPGGGYFEFHQHGTSPLVFNLSKGLVSCCHEHLTLSLAVTVPLARLKVLGPNLKFPEIAKGIRGMGQAGLYWRQQACFGTVHGPAICRLRT